MKTTIPSAQKQIILDALDHYANAFKNITDSDSKNYLMFDIQTLKGLMKCDVTAEVPNGANFLGLAGVDFPEYSEIDLVK